MRSNILIYIILILAFFGTEIQARWSGNPQYTKINFKRFSIPDKKFQSKSIAEIYEGYCGFLLGASKECMKKYIEFKKERFQAKPTISPLSYTAPATLSTTSSHTSTTKTERMHGRAEKCLEFQLEQVWKNREKLIKTTTASPQTTTARKLAYIRIQ